MGKSLEGVPPTGIVPKVFRSRYSNMSAPIQPQGQQPNSVLEEWEEFVKERYPAPVTATAPFKAIDPQKKQSEFRNYEANARPSVREFYRLNHLHQTHDFVRAKKAEFL